VTLPGRIDADRVAPDMLAAPGRGHDAPGSVLGREIQGPMAIVILGGLVTSTVMSLFLLPSLVRRFGRKPGVGA
jgi:hypothetical protein